MVDSSKPKVPFDYLLKYQEKHDIFITSFLKLEKEGAMTKSAVEEIVPTSLLKLHESLTEILVENKVFNPL